MKSADNYIEFDDYYGEWLIPLLIAEKAKETALLIVSHSSEHVCPPNTWHDITAVDPWYTPQIERLELVKTLCNGHYQVFRVVDVNAYHLIWLRLSRSHTIAHSVFSADVNLSLLEKILDQNRYYFDPKYMQKLATWGYHQHYGGGSDEHYGYFCSNKPEQIACFNELLKGKYFTQWFEKLHQVEACRDSYANYDQPFDFLSMKLEHHNEKSCYVLFRNFHYSSFNLRTFDECKAWYEYYEYDPQYYDEQDYKQMLITAQNIRAALNPLLSRPACLEFEYDNHSFKLIPVDNFDLLGVTYLMDETGDYLDGFFSMDSDIAVLKKEIMTHSSYNPERLLQLGSWAVVRQVDDIDAVRYIISAQDRLDLTMHLSQEKKDYIECAINTCPILKCL